MVTDEELNKIQWNAKQAKVDKWLDGCMFVSIASTVIWIIVLGSVVVMRLLGIH